MGKCLNLDTTQLRPQEHHQTGRTEQTHPRPSQLVYKNPFVSSSHSSSTINSAQTSLRLFNQTRNQSKPKTQLQACNTPSSPSSPPWPPSLRPLPLLIPAPLVSLSAVPSTWPTSPRPSWPIPVSHDSSLLGFRMLV